MDMVRKYGVWVAITLAGLAFIAAGAGKLSGNPMMHDSFANLGLPGWFGYFIGACEVAGGVGLFLRRLSGLAAAGLAVIMLGAIYYHIAFPPLAAAAPATVLLLLTIYIFTQRRGDILKR